jgi:hypothetical protein
MLDGAPKKGRFKAPVKNASNNVEYKISSVRHMAFDRRYELLITVARTIIGMNLIARFSRNSHRLMEWIRREYATARTNPLRVKNMSTDRFPFVASPGSPSHRSRWKSTTDSAATPLAPSSAG